MPRVSDVSLLSSLPKMVSGFMTSSYYILIDRGKSLSPYGVFWMLTVSAVGGLVWAAPQTGDC